MPRLQRRISHRGLDGVHLPGRVTGAASSGLLGPDAYLTPVRLEAFGIAGPRGPHRRELPVLARSASGVGDFIEDGVNGFLGDDDALATEAGHARDRRRPAAADRGP